VKSKIEVDGYAILSSNLLRLSFIQISFSAPRSQRLPIHVLRSHRVSYPHKTAADLAFRFAESTG